MEYEDLYAWLQARRRQKEESPNVVVNIDLGDLMARILTDRGEVKTRDRIAPYPS